MEQQDTRYSLSKEYFGPLWKYVENEHITNIDWDSGQLWVEFADRPRTGVTDSEINEEFMMDFATRVGIHAQKNFNQTDREVSTETDTLRITCLHPSFSVSGVTVCMRKSLPKLRFNTERALKSGYCSKEVMFMLLNCVRAKMNFTFCGAPGKGKTEAGKFFSSFIQPNEKVITIEDVREWHYKEINPNKSCIELKLKQHSEFEQALALAVRLNPTWLIPAETRGREVRYLLEAWSNGISNMNTIHTRGVKEIVDRILNMLGSDVDIDSATDQIYNNAGIGVYLDKVVENGKNKYFIKEVGFFSRKDEVNRVDLVVEDGVFYPERIPDFIKQEIEAKVGTDLFECPFAFDNTAPVIEEELVQ